MKVEYINPFINATHNLMAIMVGIKHFKKKEVYLDQQTNAVYDVSAIIGISGDCVGSIVLSFSNKVAAEMLSKLLGEPVTEFDDDVNDAVCEMVNIISGNACAELTSSGAGQISRALPQVIHGKGHSVKNPKNTPCINVLFETELGPFAMQISLKFNS